MRKKTNQWHSMSNYLRTKVKNLEVKFVRFWVSIMSLPWIYHKATLTTHPELWLLETFLKGPVSNRFFHCHCTRTQYLEKFFEYPYWFMKCWAEFGANFQDFKIMMTWIFKDAYIQRSDFSFSLAAVHLAINHFIYKFLAFYLISVKIYIPAKSLERAPIDS